VAQGLFDPGGLRHNRARRGLIDVPQAEQPMPTKKTSTTASGSPHKLEGKKAPDFELPDASASPHRLKDLLGRKGAVLYFYPKDMTPGCTREACGFRDHLGEIRSAGAEVIGISGDSPASHQKFTQQQRLNFMLLSDAGNKVAKLFGVYKKKSLYGREYMGIERTTFLIDKAGVVRKVFPKVRVDGHPEAVLEALSELK
jgi:thioredoxin-dependent peroxiredoxin